MSDGFGISSLKSPDYAQVELKHGCVFRSGRSSSQGKLEMEQGRRVLSEVKVAESLAAVDLSHQFGSRNATHNFFYFRRALLCFRRTKSAMLKRVEARSEGRLKGNRETLRV